MHVLIFIFPIYISLVILVYMVDMKIVYLPAAFLSLMLFPCAKIFNLEIDVIAYMLGILWISTFCIKLGKEMAEGQKGYLERELSDGKQLYMNLNNEKVEQNEKRLVLDRQAFSIGRIYEFLKVMSCMLKPDEMLYAFAMFLKDNFSFSSCHLIMFDQKETFSVKKLYRIKPNKELEEIEHNMERWVSPIIHYIQMRKYKLTILKEDPLFEELKISDNIQQFDLVPFMSDDKMVALVCFGDLEDTHRKNFSMLASQVTMELKKANLLEKVEKLSFTDGLTQIYLRRYFIERGSEEIKRAKRLKLKFAVLMLDIDNFKQCNDSYGHMVGDVVLREIAKDIKGHIREIDLVARYGGEEFTILLAETERKGAHQVAERIRKTIESRTIAAYDETVQVKMSIGISLYPEHALDLESLIDRADEALYLSKQRGRNRVTIYGDET